MTRELVGVLELSLHLQAFFPKQNIRIFPIQNKAKPRQQGRNITVGEPTEKANGINATPGGRIYHF